MLFMINLFQSTLPARGATIRSVPLAGEANISIHAPCTGSDNRRTNVIITYNGISIHAPCTGSDPSFRTLRRLLRDFNPRSLHGERQSAILQRSSTLGISIHAPCTGSDTPTRCATLSRDHFNPRSLHGERLSTIALAFPNYNFNPRSLHGERRWKDAKKLAKNLNFNPRSLHGERQEPRTERGNKHEISIHAPCTGSDIAKADIALPRTAFQSTLPARGATPRLPYFPPRPAFQSTLPARGATSAGGRFSHFPQDFNPRSLHGERQNKIA